MSYLDERVDMQKVRAIASAALNRLSIEDPISEKVVRAAAMTDGREALAVHTWPDGIVTITAFGVELHRGPVADVMRRSDA